MCGIAGIVGDIQATHATSSISRMIETLDRRGPDGEGIEIWNEAVLGHKRLAIFDLSETGRQPMLSPDRSVGIVFNGAIYNFRTIRNHLEALGYRFKSQTDTEVLIHGYHQWGIDVLASKIKGMFAFAIWDNKSRKLYLVRDRLGIKPLVYATGGAQFTFASTIRALLAAGFGNDVDDQAVADYLEFGFVTEDRTIYQSMKRLPAASILEWSDHQFTIRKYWQPPASGSLSIGFEEAVEETERLFVQAVKRRLIADVPVGTLLSGGVDSSLVCWALSEIGADINAYTVGTPLDSSDESADAQATANQLGIQHKVFNISPEDEPDIEDLLSAYPEPFACASALGMLRVSRAVGNEVTVLLTGDGGDDVFLGYPEHRHLWLAEKLARSSPQKAVDLWMRSRLRFPRHGQLRRFASLLDYASGGLGAVTNAHDGLPAYKTGVFGERLQSVTVEQRRIEWSQDSARHLLQNYLDYDHQTRFVSEFLTKVDGATMHYGLEARSPFLDQELWEFASSLPFNVRLRHGKSKAVLRELARRKIGERVVRGNKRGFTIPVQRWITGRWRAEVAATLRDSLLAKEGWIRTGPTLEWLDESAKTGWAPKQIWYLFVLERWLRAEHATVQTNSVLESGLVSSLAEKNFATTNKRVEVQIS